MDTEDTTGQDFQFYPENDNGTIYEDKMLIGQGWARLGFGRIPASANYYIRGAMQAGGVSIKIIGGATSLVAAAAVATVVTALSF